MTSPKFKIGDRVKWKDCEGSPRNGVIYNRLDHPVRYSMDSDRCLYWHESHLSLDIQETPKFKIGDRVKWAHFGKPSFGFVRARLPGGWWEVEYKTGCMANFHESCLSLDVPEPKQFATNREAELGAEIIKLHYDLAPLDARLNEEIGARHRERIAKESAQKELAEANDKIYMLGSQISDSTSRHACDATEASTVIADQEQALAEAREQIERLERKSKVQVDGITHLSYRLAEEVSLRTWDREAKETAQKELVEANAKIKRLKSLIGEL